MLERVGGTVQTDEAMCRGRGTGRNREGVDRKGCKRGWSCVKRARLVHLSG